MNAQNESPEAQVVDPIVTEGADVTETQEVDLAVALAEAQALASQHYDTLLRTQADMENLRRRTEREVDSARKFALERFVNELLPILDSMEMGLQTPAQNDEQNAFREGMEMTLKLFTDTLAKFNVLVIDPVGTAFDPQEHEALTMQPSADHAPNTVMMTIQKGYKLNDRVVRPARVIVSAAA